MPAASKTGTAAAIRASVPDTSHRVPKTIPFKEIEAMPRLQFTGGMRSGVFISKEREDSRYFSQGLCFHDADMEDLVWDEIGWDESFLCLKGKLLVFAKDVDGNVSEFEIEEGDHFWAPAGYEYTMRATGVDSINFWTMGPVQRTGWRYTDEEYAPPYSAELVQMREAATGN